MAKAPSLTTANFPDYGNTTWTGNLGNCVESAASHCARKIWGVVIPDPTVRKVYTKWFPGNVGSSPGRFMWEWFINGMHGIRPRTFCKIASRPFMSDAAKAKEIQFFLNRNNCGAVMLNVDGESHEIACVGNTDATHFADVWYGVDGYMKAETAADLLPHLSQTGHFAISKVFDPLMYAYALKNNWVWWVVLPLAGCAVVYLKQAFGL